MRVATIMPLSAGNMSSETSFGFADNHLLRPPHHSSRSSMSSSPRSSRSSSSAATVTAKASLFRTFVSYPGPQIDQTSVNGEFQFVNTTKTSPKPHPGAISLARSFVARGSQQHEPSDSRKRKRRPAEDGPVARRVARDVRGKLEIMPSLPGMATALYGSPVYVRSGDQMMITYGKIICPRE